MKNLKEMFTKSTIIISLICLSIGFITGFFIEKNRKPSLPNRETMSGNFQNRGGNKTANGAGMPGQRISSKEIIGEVTSADNSSITIKTPDGSSKIIMISDSTTVNQATQVDKTNLKVGSQVSISGDQNTDGTVTGKIINLNSVTATTTPATKN